MIDPLYLTSDHTRHLLRQYVRLGEREGERDERAMDVLIYATVSAAVQPHTATARVEETVVCLRLDRILRPPRYLPSGEHLMGERAPDYEPALTRYDRVVAYLEAAP